MVGAVMSYTTVMLAGRYRLDEPIAAGAVGEVWRGLDAVLDRPVAVKLLRAGYTQHPDTLARFRAEARHAGSLSHPGIAHVYDYGEPDPPHPPFLVMELVDGPSLAALLVGGALDPGRAMDVIAQAAAGLDAAHRAGLVHRDIKPGNLLVGRNGLVKITDFGIAHAAGSAPLTRTGMMIGTPAYLAPERVAGAPATPASDLYSLGIVAYECLAGAAPFSGIPMEVALAHRDRPLPPLPATVPAEAAALVAELTAKEPTVRPASADLVAAWAGRLRGTMTSAAAGPRDSGQDIFPATLAGMPLPDQPAGPLRSRARAVSSGRMLALAMAGLAAVVLLWLLLAGVFGSQPAQRHHLGSPSAAAALPTAGTSMARTMVEVNASSLAGRPVRAVRQQLRQLGLAVRVLWRPTDLQPPRTVLSVQPGGRVPAGSTVIVTGAFQPSGRGHGHGHDHGHGHGGDGGGGGDGGDGGGG
jgi:eukaryotic-like serine/threonine-protein kinase